MCRVMRMSLLLMLFAACGVAEPPPSVPSPAIQSAQMNAYPSPVVATAIPTNAPPTATSVPTAVASVTATPKPIKTSLVKTLTLQPLSGPHYLVGWSPDNSEILYTQIGDIPDTSEVYVVNSKTGDQTLIEPQAFGGKQGSEGFSTDYAAPQWAEQCCQVILGRYKSNGKQEIQLIDRKTNQSQSRGDIDQGMMVYEGDGNRILANKHGIQQTKGRHLKIDIPALADTDVLISLNLNKHGKALLLSKPTTMQILDLHDPTKNWELNATDLKSKTGLARKGISLDHMRFQSVRWSPDGSKIAFLLSAGVVQELWMMNSNGTGMQAVHIIEGARGSNLAWSPDNTMIAFTETDTGTNPKVALYVMNVQDKGVALVDGDVYSNPVWNQEGTAIAVYEVVTNEIRIYTVEK